MIKANQGLIEWKNIKVKKNYQNYSIIKKNLKLKNASKAIIFILVYNFTYLQNTFINIELIIIENILAFYQIKFEKFY